MNSYDMIPKLIKGKAYCNPCLNKGIITELTDDPNDSDYYSIPPCGCFGKNYYRFQYIDDPINDWGAIRGLNKNQKSFKQQKLEDRKPGICIKCGKYNLSRDNNARGRDIGYGNGEWIAENDILDELGNIIVYSGQECGCSCSKDWYNEHNGSEKMREQARQIGLKTGAIHLTAYNKSEAHKEEMKIRFGNLTDNEKQAMGDRLNDSRKQNIAEKEGFSSYEELERFRIEVIKEMGYETFAQLREQLRKVPRELNLNLKESIEWLKDFIRKKEEICKEYNIDLDLFGYYLIGARKNSFDSGDDLKDIVDYLEFKIQKEINKKLKREQREERIKRNKELKLQRKEELEKERKERKILLEKILEEEKLKAEEYRKQYNEFYEEFKRINDNNIDDNYNSIIIKFNKNNIEIKYKVLKDFFNSLDDKLLCNFVTILYGENIFDNENYCLTCGLNRTYRNNFDPFTFMRLCSRNRWDVTTLDPRNYKIKHDYDNYYMKIYYNVPDNKLNFLEVSSAVYNNALYWSPSIEQEDLYNELKYKEECI